MAESDSQAKAQVFSRELSTGDRLIFSWDSHEKVPFSIEKDDNKVILHFEKPVALRWGSALNAVHPYVRHVETEDDGSTVVLTLNRPAQAHYYHTIDNSRDVDNDENGIELVKTSSSQSHEPVETLTAYPPPQAKPAHKVAAHKKPRKTLMAKARRPIRDPKVRDTQSIAELSPAAGTPGTTPPAAAAAAGAIAAMPAPVTIPAAAPATPAIAAPVTPVETQPAVTASSAILPLPYKDDDAFAVFALQNTLWIVSENNAPLSVDDLRKAGDGLVKDAKTLPDSHATVVTMPLVPGVFAEVEKNPAGGTQIMLMHDPAKLTQSLLPSLHTLLGKASLVIPTTTATHFVSLRDPQTGNTVDVVPLSQPGTGVASPRSFVEFNLLQSAQGLAVQHISDAISVSIDKGAVKVSAQNGLAVSTEVAQQIDDAQSEAVAAHLPPTLFPYAKWKLDDEKDFVPEQVKLFHDIAYAGTSETSNKARMKLLGLYLGEGLFPEAAGVADDILYHSPKFYEANKVSALRGAAYMLMYRISDAKRDFSVAELKNDPEASMWRGLCDELLGEEQDGESTFDYMAHYDRYIHNYPPSFIEKLAIIAADRSINRRQYNEASNIFDILKRDGHGESVKKYIDYMQGKIQSETHNDTEAGAIWSEQAKLVDDPLMRARAEFSLINMQLHNGKISSAEAIKRLERLRIVWRGDSIELGVLTLLGNLYTHNKQYDKALHTMRDIVLYYPQMPEAVTTARQMADIFINLYNKGAADTMAPLDALALFYEFRDLVPIGKQGDLMIRNLADRLVGIDLLNRAALLLDHQIRNRLVGEERSQVGAHLAEIYLLNRQPEKALDTLKTTGYGDLPADLQLMRLRLTARALAQQGEVKRAIDVIATDNSAEGTLLRLSIYWDNKDWQNVVSIAEDILGNRNDPSTPLSNDESEVLLKLATAYVYEHDTGQLQYLRDYFTPLMKDNPNRANFLFITSESGNVDYDNLANLDKDIGAVKTFLKSAQEKPPGNNGLSNLTN